MAVAKRPLRVLLSYHYIKGKDIDSLLDAVSAGGDRPQVFLDSGAFSAAMQGVHIDLADYIAFCRRYADHFTVISNLDVIGNAAATWENQQRMEDAGINALPVFHTGEPWEWLDRYIDRYPYIALGGLVGRIRVAKAWLVECFRRAGGARPRTVFHGFGVTAWPIIRDFPWYTVDSSSWTKGFRWRQLSLFDFLAGRWIDLQVGDEPAWRRHSGIVRGYGYDWRDFADAGRYSRRNMIGLSGLCFTEAERWLRLRHGDIFIPGDTPGQASKAGLGIFLSSGNIKDTVMLAEEVRVFGGAAA